MRNKQSFLVSLVITLLFFFVADIVPASANGYGQGCRRHYVQHGETLSGIGSQYGSSWQSIARANGLHNPNYIRSGSVLCIPSGSQYSYGYSKPSYGYGQHSYGYGQQSYDDSQMSNRYSQQSYRNMAPMYGSSYGSSYGNSSSNIYGYNQSAYQNYTANPAKHTYGKQLELIQVRNSGFVPNNVTIQPGDTVTWLRIEGVHNVRADDDSFWNVPGGTWRAFSQTFTEPGTYPYYSQVAGAPGGVGMSGVVVVQ